MDVGLWRSHVIPCLVLQATYGLPSPPRLSTQVSDVDSGGMQYHRADAQCPRPLQDHCTPCWHLWTEPIAPQVWREPRRSAPSRNKHRTCGCIRLTMILQLIVLFANFVQKEYWHLETTADDHVW
jgi:hypothetical protein